MAFGINSWHIQWVTTPLQTITFEHRELRQISIQLPYLIFANVRRAIGEEAYGRWLDLDRLLVQLWESHSIRPKVIWTGGEQDAKDCAGFLLPGITRRGIAIIELADR